MCVWGGGGGRGLRRGGEGLEWFQGAMKELYYF